MGASIAFHLAEAGVTDVLLLERGRARRRLHVKAAGGVRAQFSDPVNIALGMRGLAAFEDFPNRPGQEIDLHQPGYLFLLTDPEQVRVYEESVALQNAMGVPSRMLSAEEAEGALPGDRHHRRPRRGVPRARRLLQPGVRRARLRHRCATARRHGAHRRRPSRASGSTTGASPAVRDRPRGRPHRDASSAPPAPGRSRSARWPASTCRSSRCAGRSSSPSRCRSEQADALPGGHADDHRRGDHVLPAPRGPRPSCSGCRTRTRSPASARTTATPGCPTSSRRSSGAAPALLDVGIAHRWVGFYEVTPDHNALDRRGRATCPASCTPPASPATASCRARPSARSSATSTSAASRVVDVAPFTADRFADGHAARRSQHRLMRRRPMTDDDPGLDDPVRHPRDRSRGDAPPRLLGRRPHHRAPADAARPARRSRGVRLGRPRARALGGPLPRDGARPRRRPRPARRRGARQPAARRPPALLRPRRRAVVLPGRSSPTGSAPGMQSVASSWGGGSGPDRLSSSSPSTGCATPSASRRRARACCCPAARWPTSRRIITARHESGEGVIYLSDQTHSSIGRGLRAIGQPDRPDPGRCPTDDRPAPVDATALEAAIEADLAAGRRPADRRRHGGHDQHRRRRRHRRRFARSAATTGCGCTSTAPTAARRRSARAVARPCRASTSPTRSSSIRTSGCSSPMTSRACSSASPARWSARSRCTRSTSPTSAATSRPAQPQPRALPAQPGAEAVAHAARLRAADPVARAVERGIALAEYAQRVVDGGSPAGGRHARAARHRHLRCRRRSMTPPTGTRSPALNAEGYAAASRPSSRTAPCSGCASSTRGPPRMTSTAPSSGWPCWQADPNGGLD